jgi:hypothetical protein
MPSSYEQEPIVELTHWSVYGVPLYGVDAPWTRHFIGFAPELGLAQVSSAILTTRVRKIRPVAGLHGQLHPTPSARRCG